MNNLNTAGAFCPQNGDSFMPLLMIMLLCPQLFGGSSGDNPMMLFLLMSMMQGGRMF